MIGDRRKGTFLSRLSTWPISPETSFFSSATSFFSSETWCLSLSCCTRNGTSGSSLPTPATPTKVSSDIFPKLRRVSLDDDPLQLRKYVLQPVKNGPFALLNLKPGAVQDVIKIWWKKCTWNLDSKVTVRRNASMFTSAILFFLYIYSFWLPIWNVYLNYGRIAVSVAWNK